MQVALADGSRGPPVTVCLLGAVLQPGGCGGGRAAEVFTQG